MYRREYAPEELPGFARRVEEAGFDELWVVEDCFYGSGIASAATALACTDTITVGVGIMPAVVRNPVFTAMEIATLSRLFPGRFLPGLGHGMADWMRQIGAFPKSQLKALEEVTAAIRKMLTGERLSFDGMYIRLDEAELVHPPEEIPPISLGVRGPKSLALSGRVADGTILSEYSSPAYVHWAMEQIARGKLEAGHDRKHRITVFALTCAGYSKTQAHQHLRPLIASEIASGVIDTQISHLGISLQDIELIKSGNREEIWGVISDEWIEQLAIAGTARDWEVAINRLVEAGAETVVLVPVPDKGPEELDVFTRHFMG
ncbi:LLM class flavin-dependent oxidoreductase [Chloroflexota bacterium]